jgi:alpha-1,6-mannosyltransferase
VPLSAQLVESVLVAPTDATPKLRVADVAAWYGVRSGGIRTYLDAKAKVARDTGAFEHHLVVPAANEHHARGRHELPGVTVGRANGYRMPLHPRPLLRTLRAVRPDIVLLHDAQWWPTSVVRCVGALDAAVVAVHHGSAAAGAVGKPGPQVVWRCALSAWQRRLYQTVDAVMVAGNRPPKAAGTPILPLRYGVDAVFRPRPGRERREHVLYAGRLSPEKGIELLLDAAAASASPWPLQLVGHGPAEQSLRRRAARLSVQNRVMFKPFVAAPHALARVYAEAACVVVPGSHETFGLVALEAAASGAAVVASSAVPSARAAAGLVHVFPTGDAPALAHTIARAVASKPDLAAAGRLGTQLTWRQAIEAEICDLGALCR